MVDTYMPAPHHPVTDHKKQRNSSLCSLKMVTVLVHKNPAKLCVNPTESKKTKNINRTRKNTPILGTHMFLHDFVADSRSQVFIWNSC